MACISFDLDASSIAGRIAGYQDALNGRRLRADPRWQVLLDRVDAHSQDLACALQALLALPAAERPDAWFVTTEGLAYRTRELAARAVARRRSAADRTFRRRPGAFSSGMICVDQPHRDIGKRSAQLLFEQINDPGRLAEQIVVAGSLSAGRRLAAIDNPVLDKENLRR